MRHALLAAALAVATLAGPAGARTWDQAWHVGARPIVRVQTNDAHVRVHVGAPGTVTAHVEYELKHWGLYGHSTEPTVTLQQDGNVVTVTAKTHTITILFLGAIKEEFTIDVTLPAAVELEVRSSDGSVDVPAIDGRLSVECGDGHISVDGARGDLTLWSGDGGIDAERLDGSLHARSGDGHMHVSGRFDHLELRSGDGHMEATALAGSKLADGWTLESGDGGIEVRIPHDLRAFLDARTGDGGLHVDLPIAVHGDLSHHQLSGELNGGGPPLRLRTGDGSLRLGLAD